MLLISSNTTLTKTEMLISATGTVTTACSAHLSHWNMCFVCQANDFAKYLKNIKAVFI